MSPHSVAPVDAPEPGRVRGVRGFLARIGTLLVSPSAALRRIEAEGTAIRDALVLVVLGTICLRFLQLAEATFGFESGGLLQLVGVLSRELNEAALVVIPAAVAVTVLAGPRRDAGLDIELAAACYVPFFVMRSVERAIRAVIGFVVLPEVVSLASYAAAGAWALLVLAHAVRIARTRGVPRDPVVVPRRAALWGALALAVSLVGLVANAGWAARHVSVLRPVARGGDAPDFTLPRIDGQPGSIGTASLRGKVVLLDFWATWCPPCIEMMPMLHDLYRVWSPRGVQFLGIDSDGPGTEGDVRTFLASRPAPYPMLFDEGRVNSLYKVRALPQLVLIGRDGKIQKVFLGMTSRGELERALATAVGPPPAP